MMKPLGLAGLLAIALLSGCMPDGDEPTDTPAAPPGTTSAAVTFPDFCKSATANETITIDTPLTAPESNSASGFYAYQDALCARYIVDIKLGPGASKLELHGNAYDLPSSAFTGAAGWKPGTAEDCPRYVRYLTFYRQLSTEAGLTKVDGAVVKGSWDGASCAPVVQGSIEISAEGPASGWNTYRVVVGVKERGTYQQVHVWGEVDD